MKFIDLGVTDRGSVCYLWTTVNLSAAEKKNIIRAGANRRKRLSDGDSTRTIMRGMGKRAKSCPQIGRTSRSICAPALTICS